MLPYGEDEKDLPLKPDQGYTAPGLYLIRYLRELSDDLPIICYTVIDESDIKKEIKSFGAKHSAKASGDDEALFEEIDGLLD